VSSRTRRTLTLCVGILSVVAGATVAGANSANAGESSGKPHASVTGTNDCVAPFTLSAVDALRVDGTTQRASTNDGLGRVYQYLGAKGVVAQVLPPPGWHPLSASDKELAAYGFPRRPSDPAGRQRWNDQMTKWKRAGNPGMCETGKVNGGLTRTITSGNWAGGMNVNGSATNSTFYDSTGEWVQPGFVNVCPGASAYSTWAGLGGVNSSRLIQAGTDEWTNNFSNSYMWW
jgi:hypothetical protein